MPTNAPSVDQLKRAIVIAEQIQKLQAELAAILGSPASAPVAAAPKPTTSKPAKAGKRTMSPEARERIAAAQRARWAKSKGTAPAAAAPKAPAKPAGKAKAKRKISPEGRAKMAAAAKKRWAAVKK
jgi:hypothetical protein